MTATGITKEFCRRARQARNEFLDLVEPVRPDLYRYCRALTGNVWDAEDLVQETLVRAWSRLGTRSLLNEVSHPRAWLFRIGTNAWIDRVRREARMEPTEDLDPSDAPDRVSVPEVREALAALACRLPPRERAAVLLRDVFDFRIAEAATFLATTEGAVKAALHRGRGKLRAARETSAPAPSIRCPAGPGDRLDEFVDAFNARDIDRLMALFAPDAEAEILGILHEEGRDAIRDGSVLHTLFEGENVPLPDHSPRAIPVEFDGEPLVVLFYRTEREGGEVDAVGDVLRFTWDEVGLRTLRWYYFSPEVLTEVAAAIGEPVQPNGYRYAPA